MLRRLKTTDFTLRSEPNIILNRTTDFGGDQNKKEFRIDHTFDAFGPFARHLCQGEIAFPVFKNQFNLPANPIQRTDVLAGNMGRWRIGDIEIKPSQNLDPLSRFVTFFAADLIDLSQALGFDSINSSIS